MSVFVNFETLEGQDHMIVEQRHCPVCPTGPIVVDTDTIPEKTTKAQSLYSFSVATPTKRRPQCDYVHVIASAMWMNTSPDMIGTVVKHWTIINADRDFEEHSALAVVKNLFELPLKTWWSIIPTPDRGDLSPFDKPDRYGTPAHQRQWRNNESMDYIACVNSAIEACPNCTHIIILEDDFLMSGNWVETLLEDIETHGVQPVTALWYYAKGFEHTGTVATMWEKEFVVKFLPYLRQHMGDFPVDWAIGRFLQSLHLDYHYLSSSLGQHIGIKSSLETRKFTPVTRDFGPNGRTF